MTVIKVPKPPQSAFNKHRSVSALLKNQMVHLQEAEFRLPARQQTNIYINRIRTEGEASEYIRKVTARLHAESATGESTTARKGKRKTESRSKAKTESRSKTKTRSETKTKKSSARAKAARNRKKS